MARRKIRKFFPQWVRNITNKEVRRFIETEYMVDKKRAMTLFKCKDFNLMRSSIANSNGLASSSRMQSSLGWDMSAH